MNLSLNFPDPQTPRQKPALADPLVQRDTSLDSLVNHLEALERQQDSPITAIRRQEARQAKFVELPEAIDPRLREALASREITRLYSHQAEAFERIAAGENIVLSYTNRERQDALLQLAGAKRAPPKQWHVRPLPVSDQGPGGRSAR